MAAPSDHKLTARWSKRERDILVHYPRSCDGALLMGALCLERPRRAMPGEGWNGITFDLSLVKELESRGYDITTLRFSVELKQPGGHR